MSGISPNNFLPLNNPARPIQSQQEEKEPEEEKSNGEQVVQRAAANAMQDIPAAVEASQSSLLKKRKIDKPLDETAGDDNNPQNKAARLANQMGEAGPSSSRAAAAVEVELTVQEKRERELLNTKPDVFFNKIFTTYQNGTAHQIQTFTNLNDQFTDLQDFIKLQGKNDEVIRECLIRLEVLIEQFAIIEECALSSPPKGSLTDHLVIHLVDTLSFVDVWAKLVNKNTQSMGVIWAQPIHFNKIWLILKKLGDFTSKKSRYGDINERIKQTKLNLIEENLRQWQVGAAPEKVDAYQKAANKIREAAGSSLTEVDLALSKCGLSSLPECLWVLEYYRLDLSHNQLEVLPEGLEDVCIEELNLSFNCLTSLPSDIGNFLLVNLYLEDNPRLKALPESLSECRSLRVLSCEKTAIPEAVVKQMLVSCTSHPENLNELAWKLDTLKDYLTPEQIHAYTPILQFSPYLQGSLFIYLRRNYFKHSRGETLQLFRNLIISSSNRQIFLLLMEDTTREEGDLINLDPWQGFEDKQFLIDLLEIIPSQYRTQFFDKITTPTLMLSLQQQNHDQKVLSCLQFFSNTRSPEVFNILQKIGEKLVKMLKPDPNGLLTKEERTHNFFYAHRILKHLNPSANSALRVYANRVYIKFDPDLEKNKNNPYHLFNELKLLVEEEPRYVLPSSSPLNLMGADGESILQEGSMINLDNLRERAKTGFYKVSDLPPLPAEIGLNYFTQLFSSVKARLVEATPQTKAQVKEFFFTLFQISSAYIQQKAREANQEELLYLINHCESLCLGPGRRLPELLILTIDSEIPILDIQFQLFCSMKALEEESNAKKEGEFFTPREIQAFKFLNILRACQVGQDEEITSYYNYLPPKFRQSTVPVGALAKVSKLCDDLIQKQIDDVINAQSFLVETSLVPQVKQQVHQKRFFKNRFAHQIGLRHRLEFDEGSQTIADNYIASLEKIDSSKPENPAQLILNKFYQRFTPQALFNALKRRIVESANRAKEINHELDAKLAQKLMTPQEAKKEKAMVYQVEHLVTEQDLTTFLTESGIAQPSNDGVINWPDYLLYNEDYTEFNGLHDTTLLAVLKQQKILITRNEV